MFLDKRHLAIMLIFLILLFFICLYMTIDTYASEPTPVATEEPTPEPTEEPTPTPSPTLSPEPTIEPTTIPKPTVAPSSTNEPIPSPAESPTGDYTLDDLYTVLDSINTTLYYIEFVLVVMLAFMAVWYFTQRV